MRQIGNRLRTNLVHPSEVKGDFAEFQHIVEDMRRYGAELTPASVWVTADPSTPFCDSGREYIDGAFSEASFQARFASMEKMLNAWVGTGRLSASGKAIRHYGHLLARHDPLGLWRANVENKEALSSLLVSDLWSIMDIDILFSFQPKDVRGTTRILEVGGGYGRLAEAMHNVFGTSISFVLVDAVPGSLYYSKQYLEKACPSMRVGSYYCGDDFDLSRFDCFIVPSWHFSGLNKYKYDICVNIESLQEMAQAHVDFFLSLFDTVCRAGGTIYLSNSHDYFFRGSWSYPAHWQQLLCAHSPRSWTAHHPSEVFLKSTGESGCANALIAAMYEFSREESVEPETILRRVGLKRLLGPLMMHALCIARTRLQSSLKGFRGPSRPHP